MERKVYFRKGMRLLVSAILVVAMSMSVSGCKGSGAENVSTADEQTTLNTVFDKPPASSADLYCLEFTAYSGIYVEDGKNEEIENVAAILVENRADVFLDKATVKYKYGDKTAAFLVTGLPAGGKCWVLEADKMVIDGKHSFEFEDCVSAFKEEAVLSTDKLTTTSEDNSVTIKNISEDTLENVCVYYKNTMDDGVYLGGITYMMNFGTLEPGEDLTKESGHFSDRSEIVRYSFQ